MSLTDEQVRLILEGRAFEVYRGMSSEKWSEALEEETSLYTAVVHDCPLDLTSWNLGLPVNYSCISTALKVMGINPTKFRKFYDERPLSGYVPNENRSPSVKLSDLTGEFVNGTICLCVTDLGEIAKAMSENQLVFKAGTMLAVYDYNTGEIFCKTPLVRDIRVRNKGLRFVRDEEMEHKLSDHVDIQEWAQGKVTGVFAAKQKEN